MLITIEVIIGKKNVTLPFLKEISPGNLPMNVHIIPTIRIIIPTIINSLPIFIPLHSLSPQNGYTLYVLLLFPEVFVG
jgi:hypothetical protein